MDANSYYDTLLQAVTATEHNDAAKVGKMRHFEAVDSYHLACDHVLKRRNATNRDRASLSESSVTMNEINFSCASSTSKNHLFTKMKFILDSIINESTTS